jgi:hypothetical protein
VRDTSGFVTLETVREHLGDRAARRLSVALRPKLDSETAERARRFLADVPGDRITQLKDRAAFAAAMTHLVRTDIDARRWVQRALSVDRPSRSGSRKERARPRRRNSKTAA